jgi:hypothetical protein
MAEKMEVMKADSKVVLLEKKMAAEKVAWMAASKVWKMVVMTADSLVEPTVGWMVERMAR